MPSPMQLSNMRGYRKKGKLRNSIDLAKLSYAVLRKDRELLLIPVFEMMIILPIMAGALIAAILNPELAAVFDEEATPTLASLLLSLALVVSFTCLEVFFGGALVAAAYDRLQGGNPNVISALGAAFKRITQLIGLGICIATVNILINLLKGRSNSRFSNFFARAAELAWDYATYLSVPAVVIDSKWPIESIKYSAQLLRKTWGEQIAARIGFKLLGVLLATPGIAFIFLGAFIGSSAADTETWTEIIVALTLVTAGVLWGICVAMTFDVLGKIYKTALYVYVTTGIIPAGFEEAELERAFVPKTYSR